MSCSDSFSLEIIIDVLGDLCPVNGVHWKGNLGGKMTQLGNVIGLESI